MDCKEGSPLIGGFNNAFTTTQQPQSSYIQYIAIRRNVRSYRLKTPEELAIEKERCAQAEIAIGGGGCGDEPPYGFGANVKKMIFGCYTG